MQKKTKQREIIEKVIAETGRPLSVSEILKLSSKHIKNIGIATVYRTIKTLHDSGKIAIANIPGTTPYYEISGKNHHHHFKCLSCSTVMDIDGCFINKTKLDLSLKNHGIKVTEHDLTLYGYCGNCG